MGCLAGRAGHKSVKCNPIYLLFSPHSAVYLSPLCCPHRPSGSTNNQLQLSERVNIQPLVIARYDSDDSVLADHDDYSILVRFQSDSKLSTPKKHKVTDGCGV